MSDLNSNLIVVSGPSGTGKDTIVRKLLEADNRFSLSVSATTRPVRGSEKDGVDYYFFDEKTFEQKVADNDFIEYAKYGKHYYGTLKQDVLARIQDGKTVILVIDVQGGENIKKMYPGSLTLFIMPPSLEVLENRLRNRRTESEEAISIRLETARREIKKSTEYDFIVINDDLDKAVDDAYKIISENIKL